MYQAWNEEPTNEIRFKTITLDGGFKETFLQQKWLVRKNYERQYEWRMLTVVGEEVPDIEPYDENPNLCD